MAAVHVAERDDRSDGSDHADRAAADPNAEANSQVLGAALCRFVLRFPPMVDIPRDELIEWLGGTLQRYLTGTL